MVNLLTVFNCLLRKNSRERKFDIKLFGFRYLFEILMMSSFPFRFYGESNCNLFVERILDKTKKPLPKILFPLLVLFRTKTSNDCWLNLISFKKIHEFVPANALLWVLLSYSCKGEGDENHVDTSGSRITLDFAVKIIIRGLGKGFYSLTTFLITSR